MTAAHLRAAQNLVAELVALRHARGLRQVDVARLMGIPRSGVANFERQRCIPRLDTVLRYADALGADLVAHTRSRR